MLGLGSVSADVSVGVRFGAGSRKRRRLLPSSAVYKDQKADDMDVHTVIFGIGPEKDVRPG